MAGRYPQPRRKTRTREHVIADLSINHTERPILLCGHPVERIQKDYGLDLMMFTYNAHGEFEEGVVYLQVKATDALKLRSQGRSVAFRVNRADLESWMTWTFLVILIVFDTSDMFAIAIRSDGRTVAAGSGPQRPGGVP